MLIITTTIITVQFISLLYFRKTSEKWFISWYHIFATTNKLFILRIIIYIDAKNPERLHVTISEKSQIRTCLCQIRINLRINLISKRRDKKRIRLAFLRINTFWHARQNTHSRWQVSLKIAQLSLSKAAIRSRFTVMESVAEDSEERHRRVGWKLFHPLCEAGYDRREE